MARQTDFFYESIRKSHRVISWIDVIAPDQEVVQLPAIDGQVDADRTAAFRRKLSAQCIDPTGLITPRNQGEVLTPYGTELRAYRGIRYSESEDDYEVCPLGVFRLSRSSITDNNAGSPVITLEAFDRSRTISRNKFKVPYVIAANTSLMTALQEIAKMTFPDCEFDVITSSLTATAPQLYEAGADPWEAISKLARSMGCEAYFDVDGRLAVLPPHDVNALTAPDFTYIEGEGNIALDMSREYSDEGVFNGYIVTGESVGDQLPPVRGEAWDENPTSPTYRFGPYGEVPGFITDSNAKTQEQCQAIAQAQLALTLGATSRLNMTGIVNPSYECSDVVQVKREKAKVDGLYVVDAFSVPLRAMTQSLSLRELRPANDNPTA
jgi:hypothetical protein